MRSSLNNAKHDCKVSLNHRHVCLLAGAAALFICCGNVRAEEKVPTSLEIQQVFPIGSMLEVQLNPVDALRNANAADRGLMDWLAGWEAEWIKTGTTNPAALERLRPILKDSPLDALSMLALAHAFHFMSGELEGSGLFYDAASVRVEMELAHVGAGKAKMKLLHSIFAHMPDFKQVFWPLIEEKRKREYAASLFRIYFNFSKSIPESETELIRASQRPTIGAAECLYVLERNEEAISLLTNMPRIKFSEGDTVAFNWIYGLLLVRVNRDEEAIPLLEYVQSRSAKYAKQAESVIAIANTKIRNRSQSPKKEK